MTMKPDAPEAIAQFIEKHGALAILEVMQNMLNNATDESRANGPNALSESEREDNWLADQIGLLLDEVENRYSM